MEPEPPLRYDDDDVDPTLLLGRLLRGTYDDPEAEAEWLEDEEEYVEYELG